MADKAKKKIIVDSSKSRVPHSTLDKAAQTLIMAKKNYILLGAAFVVVFLGLILMMGGAMPSPDVWDESLIYSFRRITLAPLVIIAGLILGLYSIFK